MTLQTPTNNARQRRLRFPSRSQEQIPSVQAESTPDSPQIQEVSHNGLRWIHADRVSKAELEWIQSEFDFHELDIEDIQSRNQRPKVDVYDDYLFIVLHFPSYNKSIGRLSAAELDIFVGPDFILTLPNQELRTLGYRFDQVQRSESEREKLFSDGAGYLLYRLIDESVDASFPMLHKIGNKLEQIEESIFEGRSREIVRDISNVKQEIINFRRVIRPQRLALRDLERTWRKQTNKDEIYFDDIVDASERIWDMLENFKEVVEALEDSNESVLSHQGNDILRVLTAFSILLLPQTLIASIFGMNNRIPGQGSTLGFFTVIAFMVAVTVAMLVWFRKRGYL